MKTKIQINSIFGNLLFEFEKENNTIRDTIVEANLGDANLGPIKADLYLVLINAIPEIPALKQSLIDGKVDGSTYTGECACLVGTIANIKKCDYMKIESIKPNASRPIEAFFTNIKEGDNPENNQCSKIAVEWIDEFLSKININQTDKK